MPTKPVTDNSFESDVIKSDKPIVVDFWAEWCGPCKQIGPALEEISDEMKDKVIIANTIVMACKTSPLLTSPIKEISLSIDFKKAVMRLLT